jgi:hypothetical protein
VHLRQILERVGEKRAWGEFVPPAAVVDFVVAYFADMAITSVVDPWAGSGMLLNEFVARHPVERALGVVPTADGLRIAQATAASPTI